MGAASSNPHRSNRTQCRQRRTALATFFRRCDGPEMNVVELGLVSHYTLERYSASVMKIWFFDVLVTAFFCFAYHINTVKKTFYLTLAVVFR